MSPIAAYYIYTANENARAAERVHAIDARPRGPSLLDRVRALTGALRPRVTSTRPA
jgi:hypothetical protein